MAGIVQMAGSVAASGASLRGVSISQHQQQQQGSTQGVRRCFTFRVRAEATETTPSSVALNPDIKKETDKVVDTVVVGELTKPLTAYCRCWRSGTFPLCDGTHAKYNKATGDNVGPLLVKK